MRISDRITPCTLVALFLLGFCAPRALAVEFEVTFSNPAFDLSIDEVRNLAYVSVPFSNQVAFVSLTTFEIVDTITFEFNPYGIDLSHDHNSLYVALWGAGDVAKVDIDSRTYTTRDLSALLGDDRTYDVEEALPDIVFVSANPGGGGLSRIVRWDVGANTAARVANNEVIRAAPHFLSDRNGQSLYIRDGFNTTSLYRLDITQSSAPIAEEENGAYSSRRLALSPDGTILALSSGQIFDGISLVPIGILGPGVPFFGDSSDVVFMANSERVTGYNFPLSNAVGDRTMPCAFVTPEQRSSPNLAVNAAV